MSVARTGEGLLLSAVAGAVDGIGYVVLHVFTAHVTGNTVHLGTAAGRADAASAWRPAVAIAGFLVGAVGGAALRASCRRRALPARAVVLGASAALLAVFLVTGLALGAGAPAAAGGFVALTVPAALAMGCENTATPEVGGRHVRTFVTGTMTALGEALVAAASGAGAERAASLRRAAGLFAVWGTYLAGGVLSGWAGSRWGAASAAFPIAGLLVAIWLELRRARRRGVPAQG